MPGHDLTADGLVFMVFWPVLRLGGAHGALLGWRPFHSLLPVPTLRLALRARGLVAAFRFFLRKLIGPVLDGGQGPGRRRYRFGRLYLDLIVFMLAGQDI